MPGMPPLAGAIIDIAPRARDSRTGDRQHKKRPTDPMKESVGLFIQETPDRYLRRSDVFVKPPGSCVRRGWFLHKRAGNALRNKVCPAHLGCRRNGNHLFQARLPAMNTCPA